MKEDKNGNNYPKYVKKNEIENGEQKIKIYENLFIFLGKDIIGEIFLFKNEKGEKIACKIYNKNDKLLKENNDLLVNEINILKSIHRSDFVEYIDFIEDEKNIYIFFEYMENGNLKNLMDRRRKLTEKEVQNYMIQLIFALNYLHSENIIHGNLNPSNLYLSKNMKLKVGGFTLSVKLEDKKQKLTDFRGIYHCIAPEILNEKYSFEVDIWSLGIILFNLLTGEYPFNLEAKNDNNNNISLSSISDQIKKEIIFPPEINISPAAKDLIIQILVEDPSLRPTLNQIIYHDFFNREGVPKYFPISTLNEPPEDFPEDILKKEVINKDLKSTIKPNINPNITYDSIPNIYEFKNINIKDIDIYITKYYDYKKKFGIVYLLNNGYIGVYFRDKSIMTFNKNIKNNEFKYKEKNEEIFKNYKINDYPNILESKFKILERFIKHFDDLTNKEEEKDEKLEINNIINNESNKEKDKEENINDNFVYVETIIIHRECIFFKLSNQTEQAFFIDKIQIIISSDVLTFIDKKGIKSNLFLKDVINNPIKILSERTNYIRYIYFKYINDNLNKKYNNIEINDNNDIYNDKKEKNEIKNEELDIDI